jgi:hypothetical protein
MRSFVVIAALLAGCATVPVEQRVTQVSNVQVCEAVYFAPPRVAQVAAQEAQRRGIDCAQFQALVIEHRQRQAAQSAAMQQMSRQLLAPQNTATCTTIPCGMGTRISCQ